MCVRLLWLWCTTAAGEPTNTADPATALSPEEESSTSNDGNEGGGNDGVGTDVMIATACIALLVLTGLIAACCYKCKSGGGGGGGDDQVLGVSMSFANPGFKAPRLTAEDDGELYDDGMGAAAPRAGIAANATYTGFEAGKAPATTSQPLDSSELYEANDSAPAQPTYETVPDSAGSGPTYAGIDGEQSPPAGGMAAAVPSYDAIDDAEVSQPCKRGAAPRDYDLEDPLSQSSYGPMATPLHDGDFCGNPTQAGHGQMQDPSRSAYDLEDPTKLEYAGRTTTQVQAQYDLGHQEDQYDLGHQEAHGGARVGTGSYYGNMSTADRGGAAGAPHTVTSYDHDSLSEEEI